MNKLGAETSKLKGDSISDKIDCLFGKSEVILMLLTSLETSFMKLEEKLQPCLKKIDFPKANEAVNEKTDKIDINCDMILSLEKFNQEELEQIWKRLNSILIEINELTEKIQL